MVEIKLLNNIDIALLGQVFNEAFSDYILPMAFTSEQFESKLKSDAVDLNYSIGAFVEGKLVGFILHGVDTVRRKKVAYNSGTGVIANFRGQDLTKKMYAYILEILKLDGFDIAKLECITSNDKALNIYKESGFEIDRKVICYEKSSIRTFNLSEKYEIRVLDIATIDWSLLASYWDFEPTWQNDQTAIRAQSDNNKILGLYVDNILVAYMIGNVQRGRIYQLAVHHSYRRKGLAKALCNAWQKDFTSEIFALNVPADYIPFQNLIYDLGLRPSVEQFEMFLSL